MIYRDLLKSVKPANALTDIKRLVADLREKTESEGEEDTQMDPAVLLGTIEDLESSVDQLSDYLTKIQKTMDETYLPVFQSTADDTIVDYASGYKATLFYDKFWYSRSYLSNEGKVALAKYLLDTIKSVCPVNLETLELIANRDPDMMLFIAYPRSDD